MEDRFQPGSENNQQMGQISDIVMWTEDGRERSNNQKSQEWKQNVVDVNNAKTGAMPI